MEEYIVSSNESPLKKIKIVTAVTLESNDAFKSPSFKSPIIRTPHDSQTLNEFQGIFASSAIHTSLKLYTDYQRSPIQRAVHLPTHQLNHQSSPVQRVVNPLPANFRRPSLLSLPPQAAGNSMYVGNSNHTGNCKDSLNII
jgi:hypothetical protein